MGRRLEHLLGMDGAIGLYVLQRLPRAEQTYCQPLNPLRTHGSRHRDVFSMTCWCVLRRKVRESFERGVNLNRVLDSLGGAISKTARCAARKLPPYGELQLCRGQQYMSVR